MRDGTISHTHPHRSMAAILEGLGVHVLLDLGSDVSNFPVGLREGGFPGVIYSARTQTAARRRATQESRGDLRWIVLPSPMVDGGGGKMMLDLSTLPSAVTRAAGAIRIDSGFEGVSALARAADQLPGVILMMVDPPDAGSPAGPEEDQRQTLVADLGFERLSLASDDGTDEGRPGCAIYLRRDLAAKARLLLAAADAERPAAPERQSPDERPALDAVVVSLPPRPPKRPYSYTRDVGADWLASCHASWTRYSPNVISVSEANPIFPDISWRKVERKPSLRQIIASLAEEPPPGSRPILLTNADIILGPQLEPLLSEMDPHVLYYCSRIDVTAAEHDPRNLELQGEYPWGYDAFFLPRETIAAIHSQMLLPAGLLIGEPYWDYALPIAALVAGHPIKKFFARPHPIVHLVHPAVSNQHLEKTERIFLRWVRELRLRLPAPLSKLITEFVDMYDYTPGGRYAKSEAMCRAIVTGLP